MRQEDHQTWVAIGGVFLGVGATVGGGLAIASTQVARNLWAQPWFLAVFALCALGALVGAYVLAALFLPLRLPPLREDSPNAEMNRLLRKEWKRVKRGRSSKQALADAPAIGISIPERPCDEYPHAAGGQCKYCHLEVAAISDAVVERCRARLVRVEKAIAQKWVPDPRFATPVRLKWANVGLDHPEVEFRDIRPGESALLDLVYTREVMLGRAIIETLDPQPLSPSRELDDGVYQLTVRVIADGRDPVDFTVMLGVMENWKSVSLGSYPGPPPPTPAPQPSHESSHGTETAQVFRQPDPGSPEPHSVTFYTSGAEARTISTKGRPVSLRFTHPFRDTLRADDPFPVEFQLAEAGMGEGPLVVRGFSATGFDVGEADAPLGVRIDAEVYFDRGEPDYGARAGRSVSELVAATRSIRTEIRSLRLAVRDAIEEKVPPRQLPASEWNRLSPLLSDDAYDLQEHAYRAASRVYVAADRMNHRAARWEAPLTEAQMDELRALDGLATSAIKVLDMVIRSWPR